MAVLAATSGAGEFVRVKPLVKLTVTVAMAVADASAATGGVLCGLTGDILRPLRMYSRFRT